MKYIFLFLTVATFSVFAHDNHDSYTETNVINQTLNSGVASAMASSNCNFDFSAGLQGCVAIGAHGGNEALVVGIGKRIGKLLLNGTVGIESGEYSAGAAVNFRFP